jgi:hypothetical protein
MKVILFLSSLLISHISFAQEALSVGAIVGDPTGISALYRTAENRGYDGSLSYSTGGKSGTQLHVDYLVIGDKVITAGDTDLDVYYGVGGRMITISSGDNKGKVSLGGRAPVGLLHIIQDPRLELFAEMALILDLFPGTAADFDLGVGARYRF